MIDRKTCTKCKIKKSVDEFYKDKYIPDGYTCQCKICRKENNVRWQKFHKKQEVISIKEKQCCSCKLILNSSEFQKDITKKTRLDSRCKKCSEIYDTIRKKLKPELRRAAEKRYRLKDVNGRYKLKQKRNREKHKKEYAIIHRDWQRANKDKVNEANKRREANKKQATPSWANISAMRKIYKQAELITKQTGVPHHVDHIVPLTSPLVQGLHCEFNLQILPAQDNIGKRNRYWPNMP